VSSKKEIKVKDLNHLHRLSLESKSVVLPNGLRSPAAFVLNMQGRSLAHLFNAGITVYQKAKSPKPKWTTRNQIPWVGSVVAEGGKK